MPIGTHAWAPSVLNSPGYLGSYHDLNHIVVFYIIHIKRRIVLFHFVAVAQKAHFTLFDRKFIWNLLVTSVCFVLLGGFL